MAYWRLFIDSNTREHTSLSIAPVTKIQRPSKTQRIDTIVESARSIFCSHGFEKGSIEDIAKDAGIAEGTIYRYFDSKRDILNEVLSRHYSIFFDDIEQTLLSIEGPRNRLRYLIRRTLIIISEDRKMCGLRTLYARELDDKRPSLSHDQNRRMAGLMTNEIKVGMEEGLFRPDTSPSIACYMIGGALELTEYSYMRTGKPIDIDKVTDSIWQIIRGGIESRETTIEPLARLIERLEHVTDRLDPI